MICIQFKTSTTSETNRMLLHGESERDRKHSVRYYYVHYFWGEWGKVQHAYTWLAFLTSVILLRAHKWHAHMRAHLLITSQHSKTGFNAVPLRCGAFQLCLPSTFIYLLRYCLAVEWTFNQCCCYCFRLFLRVLYAKCLIWLCYISFFLVQVSYSEW